MRIAVMVSLVSILLAAGCALVFAAFGSSVDEAGVLREPFFLIPLGWLFLLVSLIASAVALVGLLRRRARGES
ncbi:MAG: DUF3955 domain-containing protein [Pseudomonadota bacterium]